jgi:gliding motility-associated-like protein
MVSGTATDLWHFDNPGQRIISYPVTEPFAIFDAEAISGNGAPESATLESPVFDASVSNFILLSFQHTFLQWTGAAGKVEAYNGSAWEQIASYSSNTANPANEILDLSSVTGGVTNARIRFTWSGNGAGYWAVDNIRIYASLPLDAGVVSLDNPVSPVTPGVQNVAITLGNFGYTPLTSSTINWTVDGIAQPALPWSGSVGFGQTLPNVVIGAYNFQDPVVVKIWQSNPNGQPDPNPYNDTISVFVKTTLCGTYTIGGNNPDFNSFTEVASVLNDAGITCPVTFLVRDGIYREQFILRSIPGVSATNTVTFRSESGDSTTTVIQIDPNALKFEPMIRLDGARHVVFEKLGLFTGSSVSNTNYAILMEGAGNITVKNCYLEVRNLQDFGIRAISGSHDIDISHNRFKSVTNRAGSIQLSDEGTRDIFIRENYLQGAVDWGYYTIHSESEVSQVEITGNQLESSYRAIFLSATDSSVVSGNRINDCNEGIITDEFCSAIQISSNRLMAIKGHPNAPEGTSAILVSKGDNILVFNNFIQTTGANPVIAVNLRSSDGCRVHFNSVNILNNDQQKKSRGLFLRTCQDIHAYDNIFNVKAWGIPVYLDQSAQGLQFDHNDYYSFDQFLGYYNGNLIANIQQWNSATGLDASSLSVIPFFTSDSDLSINQALLNNAGIPVSGIATDIDGTLRNPNNPDIGAKEYSPCPLDAGINAVTNPQNPLGTGALPVKVLLQNQGSLTLNSVTVNWKVNNLTQTAFLWSGNLAPGMNIEIEIGSFVFQSGEIYTITAWTSGPNSSSDCNPFNDTISGSELAAPLCGNYTIGGASPDFTSVGDAVKILNLAGITCPVILKIREGIYQEQFTLDPVNGTSATNTVLFCSENGDSSTTVIQLRQDAQKFARMITLNGTSHIIFRELGLFTGTAGSSENDAVYLINAENVQIDRCYIKLPGVSDLGIGVTSQSREISLTFNHIDCGHPRSKAIEIADAGTRDINVDGNTIYGATEYSFETIDIRSGARNINFVNNRIEECFRAISIDDADSVRIGSNVIGNSNFAVTLGNFCTAIEISGNRIHDIKSLEQMTDGTSALLLQNANGLDVFNNFIHTSGSGQVNGILVQNSSACRISFNSVNITNTDPQGISNGLLISGTNNQVVSRNNIFNISNIGIPIQVLSSPLNLDLDRNDYYCIDQTIGYFNGRRYTSLEAWSDSLNTDANSLSVTPFYNSSTDLSINQAMLNNAATPVAGITFDIDGVPRDPSNPDIGAKEYAPCQNDAGINAVLSPSTPLPPGPQTVTVELQNQGTTSLSSVKIQWQVNGEDQTPFNWAGTLAGGIHMPVEIGEYSFVSGQLYKIHAWTSDPNNQADCNHRNDTIDSRNLSAPLCGTYTIGGDAPDFTGFAEAVTVLNDAGISCPVTFMVRDGIYYERLILGDVPGSSAENTITFASESGDSSLAVLKILPGAVQNESLLRLEGTRNLVISGLGLSTGTSAASSNNAVLMQGASDILLENCEISAVNESDVAVNVLGGSNHIRVSGNRILCPHYKAGAIYMENEGTGNIDIEGNHISGSALRGNTLLRIYLGPKNIRISGNRVENSYRALYASNADSISLTGNHFDNCNDGIYADLSGQGIEIAANRFTNVMSHQNAPEGTSAILVKNAGGVRIINNFVHTKGTGPVLGITLQNADSCNVAFNSVNVTNTDAQGRSKGLWMTSSEEIILKDNIFSIKTNGIPVHLGTGVTGLVSDYNDFYHPGGVIGKIENTTYDNLFEWGSAVNGDANSRNVNPYFSADTIPMPFQRALNGAGIPLPGIPTDLDGRIRFSQAPDIGCVEFTVDYGVLELLSPDLNCFHDETDSVTVYIRMFGDVPFNDLKVAYRLDDGPLHIDTIPGPVYGDIIHTFGTVENISAEGDYLFRIWLIGTLDDNINNDTLNAWRYSKPSPVVTMDYDNFCTGWTVNFTGSATVEAPYTIESYEWLFGDGETSAEQNPTHTYIEPGTYDVILRAYSSAGCYGDITSQIFIDPDFQGLALNYNLVNETCFRDSTGSLEIIPSGGYPPYSVFLNDQPVSDNLITGFSSGQYVIRIVDSQNCVVSDTIDAISEVFMDPQITADPLSGMTPLTVDFSFTANSPASWIWRFPSGDIIFIDTSRTPSFTFTDYGIHYAILEVIGGHPSYCREYDTVEIFVDIFVSIEVNTVFTPNGDGFNDFFEIKTSAVKDLQANIYNQWGNKVYEIEEVGGKWDGNTKGGTELPDGTYFFAIQARGFDDKDYERSGSVLLLRHAAQAFPNPVTDRVKVEVHGPLEPGAGFIAYSVYGQVALAGDVDGPENIDIDLSSLSKGIYMLTIFDQNRHYYVRIIKN